MRNLTYLFGCIFNTPLLVTEAKMQAFLLGLPALMERPTVLQFDQEQEREADQRRPAGYSISNGIATMPIQGVLVRRAGQMGPDSSPLQSYDAISTNLRRATSDSRVRGILLDVDSPGGEAGSVMDLARDIRAAAQVKPIWSIANDSALSAAYAIASAASKVWTTRSGGLGSIGTFALHRDQSQYDAKEGFRYSYVYAGDRKIDANPHQPLTDEARARVQGMVDRMQGMFVETVAAHRAMPPENVRATQAADFYGEDAIYAGLADHLGTPGEAHGALSAHVSAKSSRRAASMSEHQQDPAPTPAPTPAPAPAPNPAPPAPPAPQATEQQQPSDHPLAEVIRLASEGSQERSVEIVELCALAGFNDRAAEMLRSKLTVDQVRQRLLQLKAEQPQPVAIAAVDPTQLARSTPPTITSAEAYDIRYPRRA